MSKVGPSPASAQSSGYRRDIDGLRAIAVAAIVAFHAAPQLAPGGFVGVDIFFVISGFLITRIVGRGLDAGTFSMGEFYLRRARRIIPAYATTIAITSLVAMVILLPIALDSYGQSLFASASFLVNIFFWQHEGYFAPPAETQPLLHLWSLAVEEQFYLLWPFGLLVLANRRLDPVRLPLLLSAFAISLAAAEWKASQGSTAAFYLLPMRAWEFMLGAFVAWSVTRAPQRALVSEATAITGLALLAASIAIYTPGTRFPGLSAIVPCLGSALVIFSGVHRQPLVTAPLRSAPFVGLGLVSYSLYLWHWPLLVMARQVAQTSLSWPITIAVLSTSLAFAYVTWRWVERPFRRPPKSGFALRRMAPAAATLAILLTLGLALALTHGLPGRVPASIRATQAAALDENPLGGRCQATRPADFPTVAPCTIRPAGAGASKGDDYDVLIWGDSHADALAPGIAKWAAALGLSTRQASRTSCPPLLGVQVMTEATGVDTACMEFNRRMVAEIADNDRLRYVVLAGRWARYVEGTPYRNEDGAPLWLNLDGSESRRTVLDSAAALEISARLTVETIRAAGPKGLRVIVILQTPEMGIDVPVCLAQRRLLRLSIEPCESVSLEDFQRRAKSSTVALRSLDGQAVLIDPSTVLCLEGVCRVERGNQTLYRDDDHLSTAGALWAIPILLDASLRRKPLAGHPGD